MLRGFVGLEIDEAVWSHAVFSKRREWLVNQEVAQELFWQCFRRRRHRWRMST